MSNPNNNKLPSDVFSRPPPPPPPPPPPQPAAPLGGGPATTPQRMSASTADHPLAAATTGHQLSSPLVSSSSPPPAATQTLDDLADAFLSRPPLLTKNNYDATNTSHVILAPHPLPAGAPELERLKLLVARRAWSDVLLMSNQMLRGSQSHYAPLYDSLFLNADDHHAELIALQTHQDELVYILTVFLCALVKLGNYRELQPELKKWKFVHHNNANNKANRPLWIPWRLHILAATCLQYYHKTDKDNNNDEEQAKAAAAAAFTECLDALWAIRDDIRANDSTNVIAEMQVENALTNVFCAKADWRMALECLERMMALLPAAYPSEKDDSTTNTVQVAYRAELLSRQGRILLQAGAVDEASEIFNRASAEWMDVDIMAKRNVKNHAAVVVVVEHVTAQLAVNEGLLSFSKSQYNEAMELFRTAMDHLRLLSSSSSPNTNTNNKYALQQDVDEWIASPTLALMVESHHSLYSQVVNNMALCAIYSCRLQEALDLMESLVRENVTAHLTDRVALNLCTLYELASDSAVSARKKRVLQLIAKRFFLHDIGAECFRVS